MLMPRLRAPIVLVHGLFGFACVRLGSWVKFDYFHGVPAALEEAGNRVLAAQVHPTGSIARRAEQLKALILAHYPDEPVHLVAHSMGGLDSRYMISRLGMADRVLSLTTLGTPHRGSPFADWAVMRLVPLVAMWFDVVGLPREAFQDLTVARCRVFNELTPNVPSVRYLSVAGRYKAPRFHPSWGLSAPMIEKAEGPCDGIVSVASATWGAGCEVWDGDHMSLINWSQPGAARDPAGKLPQYARLLGRLRDQGY